MSCALELLEAALEPSEGDTYEARIVVDEADQPLCYACFGRTPLTEATCDVYWLVTAEGERGKGHGMRLLAAVEDDLRSRAVRLVRIETSSLEGHGGARRFYERAGYRAAGVIPDFYRAGDDLIILTKLL